MGTLVYGMIVSLDGYIEDGNGSFDWAEPEEDVHRYINEMESRTEILVYGRKLYEIISVWENLGNSEDEPAYIKDYARIWKSKRKIVFSTSLTKVETSNTVLIHELTSSEIMRIKESTTGVVSIGGAEIASAALKLDLLDEICLFIAPVIIGSGRKWIDGLRADGLQLIETKRFESGILMVRYRILHAD